MRVVSRPRIALIVPAVTMTGGIETQARFIRDATLSTGRYDLKIVSLAIAARDPENTSVIRPSTWLRNPGTSHGTWQGHPFVHVGARFGELEFQRFRPREVLDRHLEDCALMQVVCGTPAWAMAVSRLEQPVSVACATRIEIERRRRDANPRTPVDWLKKAMSEVASVLDNRMLRTADAIQVINPYMLEFAKQLNRGRSVDIRYAPVGIDVNAFRPTSDRTLEDPYILCVGRLDDPRKNVGLLLDSYHRMSSSVRGRVRVVLAGATAPPAQFWTRAAQLGVRDRITFVQRPTHEDLVRLYQRAAVCALTSDEEGLGIVLLEAMACAVPVVSTKSGGPDAIITEGKDGFLVPLDDSGALSQRLEFLCSDGAVNRQMGNEARAKVQEKYAIKTASQVYFDVWDRLLGA
jgi:D-inositol-3-phosphate glycosyltransferase